jgi:CHRD domain-containing protein
MIRSVIVRSGFAAVLLSLAAGMAGAQEFRSRLDGFFEVGPLTNPNTETGAIFTTGTGKLTLDVDQNSATYRLTYSGLTSNVTQAHLHFGKVHVPGGIYAFLCTNLTPPASLPKPPACPPSGGTVTGTLTAANIQAIPGQNFPAADFNALLAAVGSNTTYVNIHTVNFPAGEIRGQLKQSNEDEDEDHGRGRDR